MDELQKSVREWMRAKGHSGFDRFMIQKMGHVLSRQEEAQVRMEAYKTFLDRTGHRELTSVPTMKRWFGIGGYAVPGRETMFALCFALGLDARETEEFLMEGLKEPSFQINDYHEILYLYAFEHGMSWEECGEMMAHYEECLDADISFCQTHSTHELRQQYMVKRNLPKGEFLAWMRDNVTYFKGYSKTVLDYFQRYKRLILESVREDAQTCLENLLEDTEFHAWKRRRLVRSMNLESVRRFIYSKKKIDPELRANILEMAQAAYSATSPNSLCIRELFSLDYEALSTHAGSRRILRMTEKRMSDLLGSAVQREKQMRAVGACLQMEKMDPDDACPEQIQSLIMELKGNEIGEKLSTVRQAHQWLNAFKRSQQRRCLMIQRGDLLPMIMYMTQKEYLRNISYDMDGYRAEEVRRRFEEVANATLSSCSMALLNKQYDLDALLYLCFQPSEIYSLPDVLDEIRNQQIDCFGR